MATDVMELAREVWLGRLGWEFVPYGPEEWGWRKFIGPKCVAQQGDSAWKVDIELTGHLLAMQAVVDQTREYEIEHANPVPDYTLRRMIRERLFKALAALDKLKEGR